MAREDGSSATGARRSSARLAAKTPASKAIEVESSRPKKPKVESTRAKPEVEPTRTKPTVEPSQPKPKVSIAASLNRDPIIKHLKEFNHTGQSIDSEIIDQISLEGLSGLTLNRLFRILDAIFPTLNSLKCTSSQAYIWSVIANKYLRSPPGSNVQVFHVDPKGQSISDSSRVVCERPIKLPYQTVERMTRADSFIYPVHDGRIMGSCASYKTRLDVSRKALELFSREGAITSLKMLSDEFNLSNLYLVAHQELRRKAILPNWADPNVDIKLREYCTLELIGKSRTMGTVFPNDKTLGRYRIMLMSKGFITQYQKSASSPIEHHLKRFSHLLKENLLEEGGKLRGITGAGDSDDDEAGGQQPLVKICFDPNRIKVDRDILTMVYDTICRKNELTHISLRRRLKMPKFHIRNHLKNLISIRMIGSKASKRAIDANNSFKTYKAAYKTKKWARRKSKVKSESQQGVMAKWDEVDIKAKRTLGFRRSSFTQAEDSLLILCRITSILVNPTLSKLSWCVHKRLIRDLLHEELVESSDKTSDACLRRIKYLRRLPHNIMSINELTAELSDDPDIMRLTQSVSESDERLNRVFAQMLRVVRVKVAHLLGIASDSSSISRHNTRAIGSSIRNRHIIGPKNLTTTASRAINHANGSNVININNGSHTIEIDDYASLKRFHLSECDSVAKMSQSVTFERAKNSVDEKFNCACLVTMAFTLANRLEPIEDAERERVAYKMLDKFYGNYPEKLVSSMFSKLNKRSILTRKNPQSSEIEQIRLQRAKTRISLRLNKNVLFLLQRNSSGSLMQLAQPISQLSQIDLHESNEMASIAILTSLCSLSSFNLELRLRIPEEVVSIDQGNEDSKPTYENDCLVVQPCKVQFSAINLLRDAASDPHMEDFLSSQQDQSRQTNWLVKGFVERPAEAGEQPETEIAADEDPVRARAARQTSDGDKDGDKADAGATDTRIEADEIAGANELNAPVAKPNPFKTVEYSARLWKRLDGRVHMRTLLKLIESVLSWLIVYPGIELNLLQTEFGHLMPEEHLLELLDLMARLDLILSTQTLVSRPKTRLFGAATDASAGKTVITYEATPSAYIKYAHLLALYWR